MTTISTIGSGHIGATVARLALDAGFDVVLSNSRGPETLWPLAAALGPRARVATAADAARAGDVVVVTVPLKAYRDVPADALAGKLVIDTNNYYPDRDGVVPEIESGAATTSGLLQAHLTGAKVVKAFNNIWFRHLGTLARPHGAPDRSALPVAGDHPDATAQVRTLLDQLGYDTVDAGPLADSWRFERDTPAYVTPYGTFDFDAAPTPAGAAEVTRLLALARR